MKFTFLLLSISTSLINPIFSASQSVDQRSFLDFIPPNVTFEDVTFIVYTRSDYEGITLNESNLDQLDYSKPLVFITHGYMAQVNNSWLVDMAKAFLYNEDVVVIAVDWKEVADKFYTASVEGCRGVGKVVGRFFVYLYETYGASLSDGRLAGHSLGAHVMGFAGQEIKNATGILVSVIYGWDPAGPLFTGAASDDRLSEDDAVVVVGVHTAAGVLGILGSVGNVDFYPNGGVPIQPGCGADITTSCSHGRSYEYFMEALRNKTAFLSTQCESYTLYSAGGCDGNPTVYLGQNFTESNFGDYYLKTNDTSPYSI